MHLNKAETVVHLSPFGIPKVRYDDASYHINPIISMVTTSDQAKPWFSKTRKGSKQPG